MLIPIKDENPTESFGWVTLALVVANVAVFAYELSLGSGLDAFVSTYGFIPRLATAHPLSPETALRAFTALFVHAGWIHLGGNMLFLWIFGNNVEDVLGHGRFLFFYLACGLGAVVGHVLSAPGSPILSVGASGAVAGVLAAYIILYPRARVLTVIPIFFFVELVRLPAIVVIGAWIVLQVLAGVESLGSNVASMTGGVAWFAHIGGFATGLALIFLIPRRREPKLLPFDRRDW